MKPTCWKDFKNSTGPFDKSSANHPDALAPSRCAGQRPGASPQLSVILMGLGQNLSLHKSGDAVGVRGAQVCPTRWLAKPGSFLASLVCV